MKINKMHLKTMNQLLMIIFLKGKAIQNPKIKTCNLKKSKNYYKCFKKENRKTVNKVNKLRKSLLL